MSHLRALPVFLLGLAVLTLSGCADGNFGELLFSGPGGVCGLIILIADVWAFVKIANSGEDTVTKLLWAALVFFFPVGGLLIWYFFGPKG
jgi:hypothetical protein